MHYIIAFLTICCIAWGGLYLFRTLNILEHPKRAQFYQRKPVVNAQGIRTSICIIVGFAILAPQYIYHPSFITYAIAIGILAIMSSIDLYHPISSWLRLLIQGGVFAAVIAYSGITIDSLRIRGDISVSIPTRIGYALSMLRCIACTNAVNLFDGIEGHSSGITAIGTGSIRCVINLIILHEYTSLSPATYEQLTLTSYLALAVMMTSFVYTIIEYKPLGLVRDIGTIVYGFSLAYLSLLGGVKVGTLVVVLSLVLFDFIWVLVNRLFIHKKNPMKGDYTHIHHRLLANGRSRSEVRRFVWIRAIMMTVFMLLQGTNSLHKWIILALMGTLFFGVHIYLFWVKKIPSEYNISFSPQEVEKMS